MGVLRRVGILIAALSLIVPSILPTTALAAATSTAPQPPQFLLDELKNQYTPPPGLVLCSDQYYKFGTAQADVTGSLQTVSPGVPIVFSGTVQNNNPFPLVNAQVYVKVFKLRDVQDQNGPDVVDFYMASSSINLKAGQQEPLSFSWTAPKDAEPGQYQIATYVTTMNRFDFIGLTFTDDVTGNTYDFSIVGNDTGAVRFDKTKATVLGKPYIFAVFPPIIPFDTGSIPVTDTLVNTSSSTQTVTVHWNLYQWDALRSSELLSQKDEIVTVPAGGSAPVSYTITDTQHPIYQLEGTVQTAGGSKSIIDIRMERNGVTEPRLQFMGVTNYPVSSSTQAYACIENEGIGYATSTKLVLSAREDGIAGIFGAFASKTFNGQVLGNPFFGLMMPVKQGISSFTVTAQLYQHGSLVDEVTVPYDCSVLGGKCNILETWIPLYILIGIIIVAAIIVWLLLRRRRKAVQNPSVQPPTTPNI